MPGAGSIFVSYRRRTDWGQAWAIADRLTGRFGESAVFIDVGRLAAGRDFREGIDLALAEAVVLIAVIGEQWVPVTGDPGDRPSDEPRDYMVHEIARALERRIAVLPVLLDEARLPTAAELPEVLLPLRYRHALRLRNDSFPDGIGRLLNEVAARLRDAEEAAGREAAGREAAGREAAEREAAQREAAQREAAQREAAQREAAQREAAQREAAQREAAEPEGPGQEVVEPVVAQPVAAQPQTAPPASPPGAGQPLAVGSAAAEPVRLVVPPANWVSSSWLGQGPPGPDRTRIGEVPGFTPEPVRSGWAGSPAIGGSRPRVDPAGGPASGGAQRSAEELFRGVFGAVVPGSWADRVGTVLVKGGLRILPGGTPTAVLRGLAALGPPLLLLALVLAGSGAEVAVEGPAGEPFVFDPDVGLFNYSTGLPVFAAVAAAVLFWIFSGGDRGTAWVVAIGCELCAILVVIIIGIADLAWMVQNQRVSPTDSYLALGLAAAAVVAGVCWLGAVSWLVLRDRRESGRAAASRPRPVVVGVVALVVTAIVVLLDVGPFAAEFGDFFVSVDLGPALPQDWRWPAYLAAWTLLGYCGTAVAVEASLRASGWRVLSAAAAAVVVAVAGSVVGFVLVR